MKYPKVIVKWKDAAKADDADTDTLAHHPIVIVTLGFLIKKDKMGISVAGSFSEGDEAAIRDVTFIPDKMIKKIIVLKN